jgi:hypothetical protein
MDDYIKVCRQFLDAYTDLVMDDLFDITVETNLVKEIKDILDELTIIQALHRQQRTVIDGMLNQYPGINNSELRDSMRLRDHVVELHLAARSTYESVSIDDSRQRNSLTRICTVMRSAKSEAETGKCHRSSFCKKRGEGFVRSSGGLNITRIRIGQARMEHYALYYRHYHFCKDSSHQNSIEVVLTIDSFLSLSSLAFSA